MTMVNIKKDHLEMVQLSLEELGMIAGGKTSQYIGIVCASPDNKPDNPYFP